MHYYRSEDSRKGSTTTDGAEHVPMYENFQYSAANSLLNPYWTQNYEIINAANTVLDQMQKAQEAGEQLDEAELQCGMEARFFRGWCYFNLVRAFGEVPGSSTSPSPIPTRPISPNRRWTRSTS